MNYSFEIDVHEVLSIRSDASLDEIRKAYHNQVKKHHPDHGGDAWAFRMVTRAYELLSRERVAQRARAEHRSERPQARQPQPRQPQQDYGKPVEPVRPSHRIDSDGTRVRSGIRDTVDHESLLVDVELLLLRMEVDDPYQLFMVSESDRNLSCSLNISWPSALVEAEESTESPQARERMISNLNEAVEATIKATAPVRASESAELQGFRGWLAFETAHQTSTAFIALRQQLKRRGLGVRQWTREIVIPQR